MWLREGDEQHPPLSATSAGRTIVAVRGFHRFCVSDGLAIADPAAAVRPPQPARRLPKALPLADVEAILEASGAAGTTLALRDRALLEVLYGTGARISEAVGSRRRRRRPGRGDGAPAWQGRQGAAGTGRVLRPGRGRRLPHPVAPRAGSGRHVRARRRPLPQRPGGTAVAPVGVDRAGEGRRPGRGHPRRLAAHVASLLRHPPARGRGGRAGGAGAARPRVGDHDADLHPGHRRQPARGVRRRAPTRAHVS